MTLNSNPQDAKEPADDSTKGAKASEKPGFFSKAKEISVGEALPGWTIMRPLKKRGAKGSATAMNDNVANGNSFNGKDGNDLKMVQTNASGPGVREVDALHEVRSDDELLGDGEGGSAEHVPRRDDGDRAMQDSSGAGLEGTLSSGGEFKTYKRKYFGLVQLVLLNIIVSWDVSATFSPRCFNPAPCPWLILSSGSLSPRIPLLPLNTTVCPNQTLTG